MNIGQQIYILRKKRKISRNALAKGLCSPAALANIESGNSVPDKLLLDVLIQRLGKSPDKLEVLLSYETYQSERIRDLYEELLERGREKRAEYLLEKYMAKYPESDRVRQMYYCRNRAYLVYRLQKNPAIAEQWLAKALDITLEGWRECAFDGNLISGIEMENLLAHARMRLERWEISESRDEWQLEQICEFLRKCADYIERTITDGEENAKIFPKCAWLLARAELCRENRGTAIELCKQAFKKLQRHSISYFMLPLLELLVEQKANGHYAQYLRVLKDLYQEYGEDWHFTDSLFHNCYQKAYHLDYEFIRGERLARGYSQVELSEGIYEAPESLSRIESGQASPNGKKFGMLMERLGMERGRYQSFIATESFETIELYREIIRLINRSNYEAAGELTKELEERLDLSVPENLKIVRHLKDLIDCELGLLSAAEVLQREIKRIENAYRFDKKKVYRPPTVVEAGIVNHIAVLLMELNRTEEAMKLYRIVLDSMEASRIKPKYRYRCEYVTMLSNLAKESPSAEESKRAMKYELSCGKLNELCMNQMTIARTLLTDVSKQKQCKEMLNRAGYLCEISLHDNDLKIVKGLYRERMGEELVL